MRSTTLVDGVPLNWKDQYSFHGGVERMLTESTSLRFGYAHGNNPVPSGTLTPMTAAIMTNQLSTGFAYHVGRSRFDVAYTFDPTSQRKCSRATCSPANTTTAPCGSALQALSLGYSFQF